MYNFHVLRLSNFFKIVPFSDIYSKINIIIFLPLNDNLVEKKKSRIDDNLAQVKFRTRISFPKADTKSKRYARSVQGYVASVKNREES